MPQTLATEPSASRLAGGIAGRVPSRRATERAGPFCIGATLTDPWYGSRVFAEFGARGSNHAKSDCREMPGQRKNLARLGYVALRYPGLP